MRFLLLWLLSGAVALAVDLLTRNEAQAAEVEAAYTRGSLDRALIMLACIVAGPLMVGSVCGILAYRATYRVVLWWQRRTAPRICTHGTIGATARHPCEQCTREIAKRRRWRAHGDFCHCPECERD